MGNITMDPFRCAVNVTNLNLAHFLRGCHDFLVRRLAKRGIVMRVLICGDRNWKDGRAIKRELVKLKSVQCVIEGEASGADTLGRIVAELLDIPVQPFPAQWKVYGMAAGPIRNRQMLAEGKPDLVLAFHPEIEKSRGTKNMVEQAHGAKLTATCLAR